MAKTASEVRIGNTGSIYRAPVGTTMPTDVTTALAAAWKELGYTETGPSVDPDTNKERFIPWQSIAPVAETVTEQTITATFILWQRNAETLKLAWGGGTVTGTTTRIYTPPATPTLLNAFVIEVNDGPIIDRYLLPRASASLAGPIPIAKDGVTGYEIELTYLQPATGSIWTLLTNDTAVLADA